MIRIKKEDFVCSKCGVHMNPDRDEIIWNAGDRPYHKECIKPRNLPEANAQPQLCDGWRDAKKETPAKYGRYVAFVNVKMPDGSESINDIAIMYWLVERGWGKHSGDIIAWRELPDPPAFA